MNILVTGGAGFIGSHACKALAKNGYLPISYDNLSSGRRSAVKWGPLEHGDIGDEGQIIRVLEKWQPAALMHFAGYINVEESAKNPILYYVNNVGGTATLLKAVVALRSIPIVLSSTAAIYGIPEAMPITEEHPLRPINPYGSSKLFVERMLLESGSAYGFPWVSLRYFNAAGADPDGEIGENHNPETHLIPRVVMAALRGHAVQIYGSDYETPDGTCIRDYVHVTDIADAHVLALDYLLAGGPSCALNLANAHGYSVKDVIAAAARICSRSITVQYAPRRPGDPAILVGSAARAREVLGWHPKLSNLDSQIRDAWRWFNRDSTLGRSLRMVQSEGQ